MRYEVKTEAIVFNVRAEPGRVHINGVALLMHEVMMLEKALHEACIASGLKGISSVENLTPVEV